MVFWCFVGREREREGERERELFGLARVICRIARNGDFISRKLEFQMNGGDCLDKIFCFAFEQ